MALLASIGLGACGGHEEGRALESEALVPQPPGDLDGTDWVLVARGDTDAVAPTYTATLRFAGGVASGSGPCNRFRLPFAVDGQDVDTGAVLATRKACAPAAVARAEKRFFAALEAVDTAEMQSDRLVLTGPDDLRLVFEEADDAHDALPGTWRIVNVATLRALVTPVAGTKPTLDFGDDGSLTVDTGCNTAGASWRANGNRIAITPVRSTLKACTEPPGVEAQEVAILQALQRTVRAEATGDTAVLLDATGAKTFVLDSEE